MNLSVSRLFSRPNTIFAASAVIVLLLSTSLRAAVIWTEGENPIKASVKRHPWWYDKVNKNELSGGDFISNWGDTPGEIEYSVTAPQAGAYEFWVHANPVGTKLSYQLNDGPMTEIDLGKDQRDNVNIAADGKPDVRFIAWAHVGAVTLRQGPNTVSFRMHSANNNHGMLDCFVLANEAFEPRGLRKPGDPALAQASPAEGGEGWFSFDPKSDRFEATAGFDLRSLNEKEAGDGGPIAVKGGQLVHSRTGEPVRFWAVNGPPGNMKDRAQLRRVARLLAKYGVNLVRIHAPPFNADGEIDPAKVQNTIDIVEAMKAEGIYCDFSIYWYGFYSPKADAAFLPGYDGKKAPVARFFQS